MNFISVFRNLISKIITSEIINQISFSRSNSNHLSVSRTFQNFYQIFSESTIFFFFNDSINIRVRKSINSSTESSVLKISYRYMIHFWFLKIFKIYIRLSSKSVWFLSHRWWNDYISNSNFRSVFQIFSYFSDFFIFSFNISARIRYWNYFSFSKRSENHINFICKEFLFFTFRRWIQYFSIRNIENLLVNFRLISILESFLMLENLQELHLFN